MTRLVGFYFNQMRGSAGEFYFARVGEVERLSYQTGLNIQTVWRLRVNLGDKIWSKEFPTKPMADTHREAILGAIEECRKLGLK